MVSKETWNKDTGMDVVKTAGKAIIVCGALVVIGLTFGAVGPYLGSGG